MHAAATAVHCTIAAEECSVSLSIWPTASHNKQTGILPSLVGVWWCNKADTLQDAGNGLCCRTGLHKD